MSVKTHRRRRVRPLALPAAIMATGAVLALAACGGSSGSPSATTKNASASTQSSASRASRYTALRECLQKQGVKLPSRRPGSAQPGGGGLPFGGGGDFKPPEGASQTKFREALKKCGAGNFAGGRRRFGAAANKAALTKFAQCMKENGVKLPAPNTTGKGPVFDTKGIDTTSAAFKAAETKCRTDLRGAFGGGGGPPPSSGQAGPPGEGAPPGEAPTA